MTQTTRPDVAVRTEAHLPVPTAGKVVVLAGADRDSVAHCRALIEALRGLAREIVVVMGRRQGTARDGLDARDLGSDLGADVGLVDLDCASGWGGPLAQGAGAWDLARVL